MGVGQVSRLAKPKLQAPNKPKCFSLLWTGDHLTLLVQGGGPVAHFGLPLRAQSMNQHWATTFGPVEGSLNILANKKSLLSAGRLSLLKGDPVDQSLLAGQMGTIWNPIQEGIRVQSAPDGHCNNNLEISHGTMTLLRDDASPEYDDDTNEDPPTL